MKHLCLFLLVWGSFCIRAQTPKYPEPDFAGIPMWYDATTSALKPFERMPPNQSNRVSGLMSAEVLIYYPGETSTVQFEHGKMPPIIIKMSTAAEDPASSVELEKFTINKRKHQRENIIGQGGFGGSKTTRATVVIDFKKLGDGMYQIIPSQPLEVGEYDIGIGKQGFLFSIIAAK